MSYPAGKDLAGVLHEATGTAVVPSAGLAWDTGHEIPQQCWTVGYEIPIQLGRQDSRLRPEIPTRQIGRTVGHEIPLSGGTVVTGFLAGPRLVVLLWVLHHKPFHLNQPPPIFPSPLRGTLRLRPPSRLQTLGPLPPPDARLFPGCIDPDSTIVIGLQYRFF